MDTMTPPERSARMALIRGKGSKAELRVRRLVHGMGFRFRLHSRALPGAPDMVFASRRKAIFVHGCFWHRHPDPNCPLARLPKSRHDFWVPKLEGNRQRDLRTVSALADLGWGALEVWECELRYEASIGNKIRTFLES